MFVIKNLSSIIRFSYIYVAQLCKDAFTVW